MVDATDRIRRTWAQTASLSDEFGRAFYANLFRVDPSTKPLFVGDLEMQSRKLVETLGFIVDHLDESEALLPTASELAIRHVAYGTIPQHYQSVGKALMSTMTQILGPGFTAEDRAAWESVYGFLSDTMIKSAYPAQTTL